MLSINPACCRWYLQIVNGHIRPCCEKTEIYKNIKFSFEETGLMTFNIRSNIDGKNEKYASLRAKKLEKIKELENAYNKNKKMMETLLVKSPKKARNLFPVMEDIIKIQEELKRKEKIVVKCQSYTGIYKYDVSPGQYFRLGEMIFTYVFGECRPDVTYENISTTDEVIEV